MKQINLYLLSGFLVLCGCASFPSEKAFSELYAGIAEDRAGQFVGTPESSSNVFNFKANQHAYYSWGKTFGANGVFYLIYENGILIRRINSPVDFERWVWNLAKQKAVEGISPDMLAEVYPVKTSREIKGFQINEYQFESKEDPRVVYGVFKDETSIALMNAQEYEIWALRTGILTKRAG